MGHLVSFQLSPILLPSPLIWSNFYSPPRILTITHSVSIAISSAELVYVVQSNWRNSKSNTEFYVVWINWISFTVSLLWSLTISWFRIKRRNWQLIQTGFSWRLLIQWIVPDCAQPFLVRMKYRRCRIRGLKSSIRSGLMRSDRLLSSGVLNVALPVRWEESLTL